MMKLLIFIVLITLLYFYSLKEKKIIFSGSIEEDYFEDPMKNELNFLWSKGIKEKTLYMMDNTESVNKYFLDDQKDNDIIWIRTGSKNKFKSCDLDVFSENLYKLTKPVILITSDGDKSIPSDLKQETYRKIISHENIVKWYTQNYDGTSNNQKMKPYPIGFDLHTKRNKSILPSFLQNNLTYTDKINHLLSRRKEFAMKINKIFCDVHLSPNKKFNNERTRVKQILEKSSNMDFLNERTTQEDIWDKYSNYKFVISAFGNGLDCHRTWECLFLGAIVIVKKSSLDPLYKDLPVVIVDDWGECLDSKNLKIWEEKYSHLTRYEHLNKFFKYDHWINMENLDL